MIILWFNIQETSVAKILWFLYFFPSEAKNSLLAFLPKPGPKDHYPLPRRNTHFYYFIYQIVKAKYFCRISIFPYIISVKHALPLSKYSLIMYYTPSILNNNFYNFISFYAKIGFFLLNKPHVGRYFSYKKFCLLHYSLFEKNPPV